MEKNGYVNFNFLDSKSNINNILVGLDLDYSNKVIAPDGHELALIAFIPIENLLTIAPNLKQIFRGRNIKIKQFTFFLIMIKKIIFLTTLLKLTMRFKDTRKLSSEIKISSSLI